MTLTDVIEEIKLEISGYKIQMGLPDETLALVVKKAMRELQRYISSTQLMTIPFSRCIDLSDSGVSSVSRVYRTKGYLGEDEYTGGMVDPMQAAQWQILCGSGDMYRLNDWIMNYASWNTLMQVRNTTSTDMSFKEDKQASKLYINCASDTPNYVTIEYVPVLKDVEDIKSDYWIDILVRLSVALTKQTLGRIRTRYTQPNALWSQDGELLLNEANTELTELRNKLEANSLLSFPID